MDPFDPRDAFTQGLDLPRGLDREPVSVDDERYDLRGSEVRTLAVVGSFRVVPIDDLRRARRPSCRPVARRSRPPACQKGCSVTLRPSTERQAPIS